MIKRFLKTWIIVLSGMVGTIGLIYLAGWVMYKVSEYFGFFGVGCLIIFMISASSSVLIVSHNTKN